MKKCANKNGVQFCLTIKKMIDISDATWYDKDRNKSAISREGDGYGIGTGNKIP